MRAGWCCGTLRGVKELLFFASAAAAVLLEVSVCPSSLPFRIQLHLVLFSRHENKVDIICDLRASPLIRLVP